MEELEAEIQVTRSQVEDLRRQLMVSKAKIIYNYIADVAVVET